MSWLKKIIGFFLAFFAILIGYGWVYRKDRFQSIGHGKRLNNKKEVKDETNTHSSDVDSLYR